MVVAMVMSDKASARLPHLYLERSKTTTFKPISRPFPIETSFHRTEPHIYIWCIYLNTMTINMIRSSTVAHFFNYIFIYSMDKRPYPVPGSFCTLYHMHDKCKVSHFNEMERIMWVWIDRATAARTTATTFSFQLISSEQNKKVRASEWIEKEW